MLGPIQHGEPAMDGRGFTLFELLLALALMAALAMAGVPTLREFIRDCERTAAVNGLLQAIHSGRRLAALSGRHVDLCPTRDGLACSDGAPWAGNLLLRPHSSGDLQPRVLPSPGQGASRTIRANRAALTFSPLRPAATTATFTLCDDRGSRAAVAVVVSRSGRPRVTAHDASGRPLQCP
jgi:type IV fimbrial biogenesis protein FimT